VKRLLASQRLAFRIARREAWRYKGRSALSITLLGLPLLGVAIGASAFDTVTLDAEQEVEQYVGTNDAYIEEAYPGLPISQHTWDESYPWWDWEDADTDEEPPGITEGGILNQLPIGTRITPYSTWPGSAEQAEVETPSGIGEIGVIGYDLSHPNYEAAGFTYLEGSTPIRDQIVLTEDAAAHLEVGVGDTVTFLAGLSGEEHEVSGIVEIPWDINGEYAIASFFPNDTTGWLVDTPEAFTPEDASALNEVGLTVWSGALLDTPPTTPEGMYEDPMDSFYLTLYALIVVSVVMEVILLAGPAFAISAKRRTREFALMSANGATPRQIRGVVLAGGILFGIIAAVVAVLIGIGVVAVGRPLLEQLVGHRTPGLEILPWLQGLLVLAAIATGLLSALAAAISASRINVVAALMGRTPNRKGSKRWLVIGLIMVAGGLVAGFAGISIWNMPLMASAIVLLQLGLVACTPALLAVTAKLGRWMPLAPRMALREAGRNRGSAAPAIAAVLGVVAAGMAFTLTMAADNVRNEAGQERMLPEGTASLVLYNETEEYDPETGEPIGDPDWESGLAESEARLAQHLDDLELIPVNAVGESQTCGKEADFREGAEIWCWLQLVRPDENMCVYWELPTETEEQIAVAVEQARQDPHCDEESDAYGYGMYDVPATTDPAVVAAYTGLDGDELDAAVAVLEDGGVLVADKWAVTAEGTVVFTQEVSEMVEEEGTGSEPKVYEVEVPAMAVHKDLLGYGGVMFSPGAAELVGMEPSVWSQRYLIETSTPIDGTLREAISADMRAKLSDDSVSAGFSVADYRDTETLYILLAVAGLCALITLGSTAVSTGLIIAEQTKDMTTLGAVGAAPGLRKRFAMWQTTMIAVFGTLMGTFAGLIGYALIREALNRPMTNSYPFETLYGWELPWTSFAIMLVAVPVIAAVGALLFTKARLPSERRLT
jgi:putative ABC transport system permease protein